MTRMMANEGSTSELKPESATESLNKSESDRACGSRAEPFSESDWAPGSSAVRPQPESSF